MADEGIKSQLAGTKTVHLISLPGVLFGKTIPFKALEGGIEPLEDPHPLCEELCGRKAFTCGCNPRQCPTALEGSLE